MALNQKLSNEAANAEVTALATLLDGGFLDIYSGVQPASPDIALTGQVLLASLQFGTPAFGAADEGVALSELITGDGDAPASGTATWYRCYKADHASPMQDGSVGTSDSNCNLSNVNIAQHAVVNVSQFILTASKS